MRVTQQLPISDKERTLLNALLKDIDEINQYSEKSIYIDWQSYHNTYSPELTDPCPDYYGYYSLRFEEEGVMFGDFMTIDELDEHICFLYEYLTAL